MAGSCGLTVIVMFVDPVPPALVALTVYVAVPVTAVGVPVMAPVVVLNDKPAKLRRLPIVPWIL